MGNFQVSTKVDDKFRQKYATYDEQNRLVYSLPINNKQEGESQIYRHPQQINKELAKLVTPEIDNLQKMFLHTVEINSQKPFLGKRIGNKYVYQTYQQVKEATQLIGSAILRENLYTEDKAENLKMIGIYSKTSPEWFTMELATVLYGLQGIPFYDTLGEQGLDFILAQTQINTLFCSEECVYKICKIKNLQNIQNIVLIEKVNEETFLSLKRLILEKNTLDASLKKLNFYSLEALKNQSKNQILQLPNIKPEHVYCFSYTSGTTGNPKGAMITHENMTAQISQQYFDQFTHFYKGQIFRHFSYLPLAHIFEKMISWTATFYGAEIAYYSGDMLKLKDEISMAKPTMLIGVPRVFCRLYDKMKEKFDNAKYIQKMIASKALADKLAEFQKNGSYDYYLYDTLVFNKCKAALGGQINFMLSGSAPIPQQVEEFLKVACCAPMLNGYGGTENCAGAIITHACDNTSGHVGGPTKSTEIKLLDVPEMNYLSTNSDEHGNPLPQGEICVRGPVVFKGYYKDLEKTQEAVDEDGWLHTGDIGQIINNNNVSGAFQVIDRKKNIFKLAQGEYVAAEKIEAAYKLLDIVEDIFVYGDSYQSYLVGIIVVEKRKLIKYAKKNNIEYKNPEELLKHPKILAYMKKMLDEQGQKEKLFGFEQIKKMYLTYSQFLDLDLMTPSQKLMRHQAKKYFQEEINTMYAKL